MFDSTSVKAHLTGKNPFSFSPAGLSLLTQLSEATDDVRRRLRLLIDERRQHRDFSLMFQGESEIKKEVSSLSARTDIKKLRKYATLSDKEKARAEWLDEELSRLRIRDTDKASREARQSLADAKKLSENCTSVAGSLSKQAEEAVSVSNREHQKTLRAAAQIGIEQFDHEMLTKVGSEEWQAFIEAAHALAQSESEEREPYPQEGDVCLLCHRPLDDDSQGLLGRLWRFLEVGATSEVERTQQTLATASDAIRNTDLGFFDEDSAIRRQISEEDSALAEKVVAFLELAEVRKNTILSGVGSTSPVAIPDLLDAPEEDLIALVENARKTKEKLEKEKEEDPSPTLREELTALEHRQTLAGNLEGILKAHGHLVWAEAAEKIGGSTAHITRQYNKLFDALVTDRYVQLFEEHLERLNRPLAVEVKTSRRKGETLKKLVLRVPDGAAGEGMSPEKVLSEGEKRAVALADFLTEVALDEGSSGVILDDPVTSLDLDWRREVGALLAAAARDRQVVVFTHDLPFLYFLTEAAGEEKVEVATHWIQRGRLDDRPGYVFLENSPALERDYRKATRARSLYEKAKAADPEDEEAILRDGFGALRTCYEAFIVFELFNEVVLRFNERISFGRLKDIVWDEGIAEEVIEKCELLSTYIEGHLHSDEFTAKKPTPKTLLAEIEAFDKLRSRLRKLKKEKGAS